LPLKGPERKKVKSALSELKCLKLEKIKDLFFPATLAHFKL